MRTCGVLLFLSFACTFVHAQLVNEFVVNHVGTDTHEYIEIYGVPSTDYSALTLLVVEGDSGENPGLIERVFAVGSTGASGHWVTTFQNSVLENDHTLSFLLVENFSGSLSQDIDANDDGVIDYAPWTALIDAAGITDGGAGDHNYGTGTFLAAFYDGVSFVPGGASRIPDGANGNGSDDWVRNDFHGEGLPGFTGTPVAGEAYNTPGAGNQEYVAAPALPPRITEFVFSYNGGDDYEFVEIHGQANSSHATYSLLLLEGDGAENPGVIDWFVSAGTTDNAGFWATAVLNGALENGGATLLLVEGFSGALSQDLDANDDGTFDATPWTTLVDSVAVHNQGGSVLLYSTADLGAVAGASRFPYYQDNDDAGDWVVNNPDLETQYGGTLAAHEALNTRGTVNLVALPLYYSSVSQSSSAAMRSSLHALMAGHIKFPYSDGGTDTWDILEAADEDPGNAANVIDIYKNASYTKFGGGTGPYNREHTWPKSYGFPDDTPQAYPYTDCHHLRVSDVTYNSDRGNAPFNDCPSCTERTTLANNGQGGGSGVYPGNSNWFNGSGTGNDWQTWAHRKGDVARSILYMDLRYEGGTHPATGVAEPDLVATDIRALIQASGSNTTGQAYMGLLSVVLAWHQADPPDAEEIRRNDVVARYQGNRNPFVDHPEWVDCVYAGSCSAALPPCLLDLLPEWSSQPSLSCSSGLMSVLDFSGLVGGLCSCPSPLGKWAAGW